VYCAFAFALAAATPRTLILSLLLLALLLSRLMLLLLLLRHSDTFHHPTTSRLTRQRPDLHRRQYSRQVLQNHLPNNVTCSFRTNNPQASLAVHGDTLNISPAKCQLVEQFKAHVHVYAEILHRWKMDRQKRCSRLLVRMSLKKECRVCWYDEKMRLPVKGDSDVSLR
jgi:hypothetical protein